MTTVEEALALAARGFYVFPIDHPDLPKCIGIRTDEHDPDTCTQRGKHPYVPFTKQASIDAKTIAMWFAGHTRNVGIYCGASGLLVVDEDVPDLFIRHASGVGGGVPETFTVTTGKGRHYYFRAPTGVKLGNTTGDLPAGIDIRAGHAYAVAPTSQHANGTTYIIENDAPVAPCPDWLIDALAAHPAAEWNSVDPGYTPALLRIPAVVKGPIAGRRGGERHQTLVRYACSLRARNVPIAEAELLISHVWRRCEQPPACDTELPLDEALAKLRDCYQRYDVSDAYKSAPATLVDESVDGAPRLWKATDLRPAQQPRWLAKGRLPRDAVSLLIGDEGIGKSLFWCWMVAAITTGTALTEFGIPARSPAHVILVCTEDDWPSTVRPRLEIAGADLDMVHVICTEDDGSGSPVFPRDCHLILEADVKPALVVVDAWLDTVSAGLSVRDPQQARQALHPWKEVATATGAAVVLLCHTNRVASPNARDRYGASYALRQKARLTLYAQQDDEGCLLIGPEKANGTADVPASRFTIIGKPYFAATDEHDGTVPVLSYLGESDRTAREHVAASAATVVDDAEFDLHDYTPDLQASWLYRYLDDAREKGVFIRPKDAIAVAADKGISRRSVFRLFDALANAGMARSVDGTAFPRVTHWEIVGGTTGAMSHGAGTTGTTGSDLHKQGGTTGSLWVDGGTTADYASDQAIQADGPPVVPVVPPAARNAPPGGISSRTIGMTDRVIAALAKATANTGGTR